MLVEKDVAGFDKSSVEEIEVNSVSGSSLSSASSDSDAVRKTLSDVMLRSVVSSPKCTIERIDSDPLLKLKPPLGLACTETSGWSVFGDAVAAAAQVPNLWKVDIHGSDGDFEPRH